MVWHLVREEAHVGMRGVKLEVTASGAGEGFGKRCEEGVRRKGKVCEE